MVKKLKKCLLIGAIVFALGGCTANAASFNVQNEQELRNAIIKAQSNDTIVLDGNVTLNKNLNIDKSVVLDLNGKTVVVSGNSSSICVGKKESTSKRKFLIKKRVFNYDDTLDVTIKNGTIVHSNGLAGKNGVKNSWFNYCGREGITPSETLGFESGKLFLENVSIYAGNGGNGGNGAPQASVHLIGGGGIGGRGGNAGNGGNALRIFRKECNLQLGNNVLLKAGKAGKVGKNSKANKNYWVYKPLELKVTPKSSAGKSIVRDFKR